MALVTRSTTAGVDANQFEQIMAGELYAGEALDIAAPCYIKSSDGKIYMTNATAANEAAEVSGFTPRAYAIGQPVTLVGNGSRFKYGTSLTPGDILYAAATAGRLDTAATVGDAFGCAQIVSATDIIVMRTMPSLTSATVGAGTITVTELANDAVETAKIKNVNVTQAKIEVGAAGAGLTGLVVKFVAADNVIGGLPVVHKVAIAAGANATKAVVFTHKTEIIDIIVRPLTSVANAVCSVTNVANAMSDAMVAAVAGVQTHAASIVPAQKTIAAGAELRVTFSVGATQPDADVYIIGMRVA